MIFRTTKLLSTLPVYIFFLQKWDKEDYRLARFMNSPKQVNPNWAVNLIAVVPPQAVDQRVVWCDGGSGPEGHPRVYINLVSIFYSLNKRQQLYNLSYFQFDL